MPRLIRALSFVIVGAAISAAPGASLPAAAESETIVFASNRAINLEWPDIFVASPAGGRPRNLTRSAEIDEQGAAWSPDGKRIAFGSQLRTNASSDIFVMDADGINIVQLTTDREIDQAPAWSPDGREIAFESFRGQRLRIWVMKPDGSNQHPITGVDTSAVDPSWSPNGKRLAFSGADVEMVNADGTGHRVVTRGDAFAIEWSRSGRIGFIRDTADALAVFSVRPDGRGLHRLTGRNCEAQGLAWSPNGRSLVVACSTSLWIYRADGKRRRRLRVRQPRGAVEHAVSFADLSWSKAGIAYSAASEFNDSDLWTMRADGTSPHVLARDLPPQHEDEPGAPSHPESRARPIADVVAGRLRDRLRARR
jgi:Tol biopolymer transport system component